MKWTYHVKSKVTTSVLLFLVIGLVMYTNFSEQQNSTKISAAMSTLYEDRLVVEGYIFQYGEYLHEVIGLADHPGYELYEKQERAASLVHEIKTLNTAYGETKLTADEELNFTRFTGLCHALEQQFRTGEVQQGKVSAQEALSILTTLSSIQMAEAKIQLSLAQQLFNTSHVTAQFEMTVLIVVALIIQALLFASHTLRVSVPSGKARLN